MAQQTSVVQEGFDRVQTAVRRMDREFRKLQRELESRRKRLEKQITTNSRRWNKQAQKQVQKLRTELRKQPLLRRAEELTEDATRQLGRQWSAVLDAFPIVTKREVERIDRKIAQLNRKVRELEKTRSNGAASQSA